MLNLIKAQEKLNKVFSQYKSLASQMDNSDNTEFNNRVLDRIENLISTLNVCSTNFNIVISILDKKGKTIQFHPTQFLTYFDYKNLVFTQNINGEVVICSVNLKSIFEFSLNLKEEIKGKTDALDDVINTVIEKDENKIRIIEHFYDFERYDECFQMQRQFDDYECQTKTKKDADNCEKVESSIDELVREILTEKEKPKQKIVKKRDAIYTTKNTYLDYENVLIRFDTFFDRPRMVEVQE
jgi:hypothetical protein